MFTRAGPKRDELQNLKFCVCLTGYGWDKTLNDSSEQHETKPNIKKTVKVCFQYLIINDIIIKIFTIANLI